MRLPDLATSRYSAFLPEQGTPVRITAGRPRFALPYLLPYNLPQLAPKRTYLGAAQDVFRVKYFAQLDLVGLPTVAGLLNNIADDAGGGRLVLLCFEDLSKPGLWCHRRLFADWWRDACGDDVPDIAAKGRQPKNRRPEPLPPGELDDGYRQLDLFDPATVGRP